MNLVPEAVKPKTDKENVPVPEKKESAPEQEKKESVPEPEKKEQVQPQTQQGTESKNENQGLMESLKNRVKMEGLLKQARTSLESFMNPGIPYEKQIPSQLIKNAKGLVFLTIFKAGFIVSGEIASGVVITRNLNENKWSQPIAIGSGGIGWGIQIGASKIDCVLILNTEDAIKLFTSNGQLKLGGDLNISAGPTGRNTSLAVYSSEETAAPILSYSMAGGAYVGVSFSGSVIAVRNECNSEFYGKQNTTVKEILDKSVTMPTNADYNLICDELDQYINLANVPKEVKDKETTDTSGNVPTKV